MKLSAIYVYVYFVKSMQQSFKVLIPNTRISTYSKRIKTWANMSLFKNDFLQKDQVSFAEMIDNIFNHRTGTPMEI